MIAYLVARDGSKWRDVFRLVPGQLITIGRAATNRIVVVDEICSRNHCEVFLAGQSWTIRDLGSRNGTRVDGRLITGDYELTPGQVIRLGNSELAFTLDLHATLPVLEVEGPDELLESDTGTLTSGGNSTGGQVEIIERTRHSKGLHNGDASRRLVADQLAELYRFALSAATAGDATKLAEGVLDHLLAAVPAEIGAVLLLARDAAEPTHASRLKVAAYKSRGGLEYELVSSTLSQLCLERQEAILARDVASDQQLSGKKSLDEIAARSVICAPIRAGQVLYGLVHLYATAIDAPFTRDHLEYTLAVADHAAVVLEKLLREETLSNGLASVCQEVQTLRAQLATDSELVGSSTVMEQISTKIARVAPTDATVLIRGESGVGKELVARAIHYASRRKTGPFVCLNCAALSESLLESELFGHEKGSFTGATARKLGKFEQADGGTLMLDEVGEMSPAIQAKFLRVLEGHPFERVGGGTSIRTDVRVLAATNRDLEKAVEEGQFRRDLYFRLHVVELFVAPLRERPSDVRQLAEHFRERFSRKTGRRVVGFTSAALQLLEHYAWPGNVRELQHAVERAVILCAGDVIAPSDIQLSGLGRLEALKPEPPAGSYREVSLDTLEQEHILATLARTGGNKSQAAQILGIERSTLDRKLKRFQEPV